MWNPAMPAGCTFISHCELVELRQTVCPPRAAQMEPMAQHAAAPHQVPPSCVRLGRLMGVFCIHRGLVEARCAQQLVLLEAFDTEGTFVAGELLTDRATNAAIFTTEVGFEVFEHC